MGRIYISRNKKNDKYYIGQTTQSIKKRFLQHLREGNYFSRSLKKNGLEKFRITSIEMPDTALDVMESLLINHFNSMAPNGYNLTTGGSNGRPSKESRKRMSEAHKGKIFSEEHKRKLSESMKGKKRRNMTRTKHPHARAVILTHPDGTKEYFDCMRGAVRKHGLTPQSLTKVAKGKLKHHKGFKCRYVKITSQAILNGKVPEE